MRKNFIKSIIFFGIICLSNYSYAQDSVARDYLNLKPTPTPDLSMYNIQYIQGFFQIKATPTPVYLVGGSSPTSTPTPTALYSVGDEPSISEVNEINDELNTNIPRWRMRMADNSSQINFYNCAEWSISSATDDIYQFTSRSTLVTYILGRGFQACSPDDPDRSLFIMDTDPNPSAQTVEHVCNRFRGFGPPWDWEPDPGQPWLWESKLGTGSYRIIHEEQALVGSNYGEIIRYFKRN